MQSGGNLLAIPSKRAQHVDVKDALRRYLRERTDMHPDMFKADINRWDELRRGAISAPVHIDSVNALLLCVIT
jgi:programmed cell death 6-interacting protein